jgi:hypothetical protein
LIQKPKKATIFFIFWIYPQQFVAEIGTVVINTREDKSLIL